MLRGRRNIFFCFCTLAQSQSAEASSVAFPLLTLAFSMTFQQSEEAILFYFRIQDCCHQRVILRATDVHLIEMLQEDSSKNNMVRIVVRVLCDELDESFHTWLTVQALRKDSISVLELPEGSGVKSIILHLC